MQTQRRECQKSQHVMCFSPLGFLFAAALFADELTHSEWSQDDNATSVLGYGIEKGLQCEVLMIKLRDY